MKPKSEMRRDILKIRRITLGLIQMKQSFFIYFFYKKSQSLARSAVFGANSL